MDNSPIGVFDSGMGGLSVWRELRRVLPGESLLYYADAAHCPYGDKPQQEVAGYIDAAVGELMARGVKMIVLACNTATMISINRLREKYDIPFVGAEPAVKPAVESTRTGVVGVLATKAALDADWFADVKARYSNRVKIIPIAGEGFVSAVEAGEECTPQTMELVKRAVAPMVAAGADRIVLGCTHYPFLRDQIEKVAGPGIEVIDPAPSIARRAEWLLNESGRRADSGHIPALEFLTSADDAYLEKLKRKASEISHLPSR